MDTGVKTFTIDSCHENQSSAEFHKLWCDWTLWAHLPHNTDWTIKSYIDIQTFNTVEETIALAENIPPVLVENCMLFLMKKGIKPVWEDEQNCSGGSFSYKISNKNVTTVWKHLIYAIVGNTCSYDVSFVKCVNGITISPKKNFCIIKIWMSNCKYQNPSLVTNKITGLSSMGCLFKKHNPEY